MLSAYCLDTSAYSNFRRGNEEVAALLDQAEMVGVPTVALGELRKAGTPVSTNDIWIAATAARNGTTVLTCYDHFERIGRVGSVVIGA